MGLRVLSVVVLGAILSPALAQWHGAAVPLYRPAGTVPGLPPVTGTSHWVNNRQHISTIPGDPSVHLVEQNINRMRITTILPNVVPAGPVFMPPSRGVVVPPAGAVPAPVAPAVPGRRIGAADPAPDPARKVVEVLEEDVDAIQVAPVDKGKEKDRIRDGASITEEVLDAKNWTCGRVLEDSRGRRWYLIDGVPQADKPTKFPGWVLRSEGSPTYFYSRTGRIFRLLPPGAAVTQSGVWVPGQSILRALGQGR